MDKALIKLVLVEDGMDVLEAEDGTVEGLEARLDVEVAVVLDMSIHRQLLQIILLVVYLIHHII